MKPASMMPPHPSITLLGFMAMGRRKQLEFLRTECELNICPKCRQSVRDANGKWVKCSRPVKFIFPPAMCEDCYVTWAMPTITEED